MNNPNIEFNHPTFADKFYKQKQNDSSNSISTMSSLPSVTSLTSASWSSKLDSLQQTIGIAISRMTYEVYDLDVSSTINDIECKRQQRAIEYFKKRDKEYIKKI